MGVQDSYTDSVVTGFAGQLADDSDHDCIPMRNDESVNDIAPGQAVRFGSTSDHRSCKLPAADSDKIAGIVVHTHEWDPRFDLGTGASGVRPGIKVGRTLSVMRKGRIKVIVEDAVQVGDRLWVRAVAGGDPEFLGNICNADDSSDTVDCTNQGVFLTAAAAGALAVLEVDFTNKPGV